MEERGIPFDCGLGERDPDYCHGCFRAAGFAQGRLASDYRRIGSQAAAQTMYKTILVTVDGTPTDRAIIEHVKMLAKLAGSRVVLLHVADGWAARTYGADAVSQEITDDKAYLEKLRAELQSEGIPAESELAYGDPAREITRWVGEKRCDLVAMSTHGHRFLADIFLGTTASRVQHSVSVPVLLLRAK